MLALWILIVSILLCIIVADIRRDARITRKLDDLKAIRENAMAMYEMGNSNAARQFDQDYMNLSDEVDREINDTFYFLRNFKR